MASASLRSLRDGLETPALTSTCRLLGFQAGRRGWLPWSTVEAMVEVAVATEQKSPAITMVG